METYEKQKNRHQLCLLQFNKNVDLKITKETIENVFQFDRDKP